MVIELITLCIGAIFIENFVLVKFLGICSFLGVSKKTSSAIGMGLAVTFVMTLSAAFTWVVNNYLLIPNNLVYLQTIAFILVIASLVQFVEMFLKKMVPILYHSLGIYLPLITTNCAVLAVTLINAQKEYNFIFSVAFGFCAGIGYMLAIVLFSAVRERIALCNVPKSFEGMPIALVASAILAIVFMGFQGLKFI